MDKARILIVEDEVIIAMEIENSLQNLGYVVISVVDNGDAAIKKIEKDKPDLILMDIRINGDKDGIETAEIIKNRFSIPVVFSTAYLDEERIGRAKITMPFGYLLKPIQTRDLKVTIEMALYVAKIDTERKRHEDWLYTSLNSIGDAVITTDLDGRISLMNPVAVALTGWSEADAIDKPIEEIFNIINEETKRTVENPVNKAIREKRVVGLTNHTILLSKHGKEIPIDDSASPIRNEYGEMYGVVLVFRDITDRKRAQHALRESESRVKRKLDAILTPEGDIGSLSLGDLIDVDETQSMMNDFFEFTNVLVAILDKEGNILVSNGWQDICTRFHRKHPETAKFCVESDTILSKDVPQGEFKRYKCKNNLWDISTPIMLSDKHIGNVFFGQFFFDDECVDREFFKEQAKKYGFNEDEYLAALAKVPKLNKEKVESLMRFYTKFATIIAKQAFNNLKLARTLNQNG